MILLSREQTAITAVAAVLSAALLTIPSSAGPVGAAEAGPCPETGSATGPPAPPDSVAPPADHHMHVWSADARDALVRIMEALGQEAPPGLPAFDAGAVIGQLDEAGIRRGVLLSTAYFFGNPDVDFRDERRKVREENDWVARQAASHPDRLVAFFGVNPLAEYAPEEVERCTAVPECAGIKLHLANSGVDLRDSTDVRGLRRTFETANRHGLPVIIHLQTRREDFGREDVNAFVDHVLPAAPEIPVQVAHLGGDSRFDAPTRRAVDAFLAAIREHPERTSNVYFDMALVPFPLSHAGKDSARRARYDEMNRGFAEAVRRIGPDRIVFGTDFPEYPPGAYVRGLAESLPLTESEFRDLLDDPAPYLD